MLYANDKIFNVEYNAKLDRLEIKPEGWTSYTKKMLKQHKFITVVVTMFIVCSFINFVLIYNFMEIIKNI